MQKRGRVELIVLLAIAVVGVVGTLFLIGGSPSAGFATYGPSPGVIRTYRDVYVPPVVNLPGNQYVDYPYASRLSQHQWVYAPSYNNPGEERMSMNKCQSFCFGRPANLPEHLYPKKRLGGIELRACIAECMEQRVGLVDQPQLEPWYYGGRRPLTIEGELAYK